MTQQIFEELDGTLPQDEFRAATAAIVANIEQVIEGKTATVRLALAVLLAEGHLLIEDVPGVGKTKLAKALARSIDCSVRRIQFTPDLLPSDVTGVSVYNQETRDFEFKPGRGLRQPGRRRRDQPGLAEDPVGAAGVHGGAAGHRRRRDLPAAGAVHGDRHPEPDRDGGHLPAARGAARPVHRPDRDGLPGRRRRAGDARRPRRRTTRWTTLRPVTDADDGPPADRHGPRRARRRRGQAVRGRPGHRHPRVRPSCAWAPRPGRPCSCCAPPGRSPRWRAATTSSPTTCRRWPCRCWPTGSSRPPTPSSPGAHRRDRRRAGPAGPGRASTTALPPAGRPAESNGHRPAAPRRAMRRCARDCGG